MNNTNLYWDNLPSISYYFDHHTSLAGVEPLITNSGYRISLYFGPHSFNYRQTLEEAKEYVETQYQFYILKNL